MSIKNFCGFARGNGKDGNKTLGSQKGLLGRGNHPAMVLSHTKGQAEEENPDGPRKDTGRGNHPNPPCRTAFPPRFHPVLLLSLGNHRRRKRYSGSCGKGKVKKSREGPK
jgi:hypothetical protein